MFANLVLINPGRYIVKALLATTLESDWLWLREQFTKTFVKPRLNCDLNFVIKSSHVSDRSRRRPRDYF